MGWQCCAQEGLEGQCDLGWGVPAGAGGCPWALSCLSHILHSMKERGLCPALNLSTGSCLFPDTGFTVQQLNSLRTGVFLPLHQKLSLSKALTMQDTVLEEHTEIQVLQQVLNSILALKSLLSSTKSTQTQMNFPVFLIFGCSLGSRQSSCRSGSFSFSLCLVFRTRSLLCSSLACFLYLFLVLKSTFFGIKASPVSCRWCLSTYSPYRTPTVHLQNTYRTYSPLVPSFAVPCLEGGNYFLLFPLSSGGLEQPPKLSKSTPDDQQLSLLSSQSLRCSSYLRSEAAAFSLAMAVAVEQTFGSI